jgi:hypothetical protein
MVFRGPLVTFDYVAAIPRYRTEELEQLAGRGSKLAAKYKVHLQHVTVATMPEDHESRLKEMFPVGHYVRRGQSLYAFGKEWNNTFSIPRNCTEFSYSSGEDPEWNHRFKNLSKTASSPHPVASNSRIYCCQMVLRPARGAPALPNLN